MLACILFVFGTLGEYAAILFAVGLEPTAEECIDEDESKITNGGGRNLGSQNIKSSPPTLPYKWYFFILFYHHFFKTTSAYIYEYLTLYSIKVRDVIKIKMLEFKLQ